MTTIADVFNQALQCHQAGDLPRAEQLYRQVLAADPRQARALHFLGVVAFQTGRAEAAIEHMEAALKLDARSPEFFNNLGVVYQQRGDLDRATQCYRRALQIDPRHAEAHKGLGDVHIMQRQFADAAGCYQAALAIKPDLHDARVNLGSANMALDNFAGAEQCFRMVLQAQPQRTDALMMLADLLQRRNRLPEAIDTYYAAVRTAPKNLACYIRLGLALQTALRLEESLDCYRTALGQGLNDPTVYVSQGDALQLMNRVEDAKAAYLRGTEADPQCRFAWAGLGMTYQVEGDFAAAEVCYRRALEIDPGFGQAHFNLAALLLVHGQLAEGWKEYAWRWKIPNAIRERSSAGPLWDGSPLPQGTLLMFGEQGLGDTLQFIRYAPQVRQRVGRVILECSPSLRTLLARVPGIDQVVARGEPRPVCDAQVPLLSLPGIFETVLETVPAEVPYLSADPQRVARWRAELNTQEFRVGVAWQGNPQHRFDRFRSFSALSLLPLAGVPGVRLYSLQKGPGSEQLPELAARSPIVDLAERIQDFDDAAAVMQNLDLVVSCDSAPVHLAGGLGVRVWVPLPYTPDWRWLLDRDDSPWYPTMRLFRQPPDGNWEPVFQRLAAELAQLVVP